MQTHFHVDKCQDMRTKIALWQADVVTEVTLPMSKFRHRDFADEKYLTRFVRQFHTPNNQAIQARLAKEQSSMREKKIWKKAVDPHEESMTTVFKPLEKYEEIGDPDTKAFKKTVGGEYINPKVSQHCQVNSSPAYCDVLVCWPL